MKKQEANNTKTLVFAYGTLRKGQHNHGFMKGAKYLGTGKTEPTFTLVNLGEFPGMYQGGNTAIVGEIYEVNEKTLEDIDYLEGHPIFYRRRTITLESGLEVQAYFLQSRSIAYSAIASGDWKKKGKAKK